MAMTISDATALNKVLRWAMGLPQPGTGTISDGEATEAARRLVERANKTLGAGLLPGQVTLTRTALAGQVYDNTRRIADVSDIDGVLAGFEILETEPDGETILACAACKQKVCDVGDCDPLDTLVRACLDHDPEGCEI